MPPKRDAIDKFGDVEEYKREFYQYGTSVITSKVCNRGMVAAVLSKVCRTPQTRVYAARLLNALDDDDFAPTNDGAANVDGLVGEGPVRLVASGTQAVTWETALKLMTNQASNTLGRARLHRDEYVSSRSMLDVVTLIAFLRKLLPINKRVTELGGPKWSTAHAMCLEMRGNIACARSDEIKGVILGVEVDAPPWGAACALSMIMSVHSGVDVVGVFQSVPRGLARISDARELCDDAMGHIRHQNEVGLAVCVSAICLCLMDHMTREGLPNDHDGLGIEWADETRERVMGRLDACV